MMRRYIILLLLSVVMSKKHQLRKHHSQKGEELKDRMTRLLNDINEAETQMSSKFSNMIHDFESLSENILKNLDDREKLAIQNLEMKISSKDNKDEKKNDDEKLDIYHDEKRLNNYKITHAEEKSLKQLRKKFKCFQTEMKTLEKHVTLYKEFVNELHPTLEADQVEQKNIISKISAPQQIMVYSHQDVTDKLNTLIAWSDYTHLRNDYASQKSLVYPAQFGDELLGKPELRRNDRIRH